MTKNIVTYFIPKDIREQPEELRKYKLVVSIILITAIFDLNYVGVSAMVGLDEGIPIMLLDFTGHIILPFFIRLGLSLVVSTNIYVFFGVFGIVGCTYFSGGFYSPVIVWLASTPIVALLMAGKRTGMAWMIVNTLIVILFGSLSKSGYSFPNTFDPDWQNMFYTNTFTGLVIIIFVVALVFENGKNAALKQLAAKNALLAEEKKKNALYAVSQDIHDNVGQRLFLTKLSLSGLTLNHGKEDARLSVTIDMLGKAIDELRNISHEINAENRQEFDLIRALSLDLTDIEEIGTHKTTLRSSGAFEHMNPSTTLTLYRISQELINNILKHARASQIDVTITSETPWLELLIMDDGVGMVPEHDERKGQGLRTVRERVEKVGGEMSIVSEKGKGTRVNIRVAVYSQA